MNAPEQIYAWEYKGHTPWGEQEPDYSIVTYGAPYIREDVAQAMAQKARDEARQVKPLVWTRHPHGEIASTGMGSAYVIDVRDKARPQWLRWPGGHGAERETVTEMKAAAQADYEARILSALKGGEA